MKQPRRVATEKRILAAAIEYFNSKPFAELTMEELSQSAASSIGAVYKYYGNKEALFDAVFEYILEDEQTSICEYTDATANQGIDQAEKFKLLIANLVDSYAKHQHLVQNLAFLIEGKQQRYVEHLDWMFNKHLNWLLTSSAEDDLQRRKMSSLIIVVSSSIQVAVLGEWAIGKVGRQNLIDDITEIALNQLGEY